MLDALVYLTQKTLVLRGSHATSVKFGIGHSGSSATLNCIVRTEGETSSTPAKSGVKAKRGALKETARRLQRRPLAGGGLRRVEDRLHVIAVWIEDERREIPTAVLGSNTRRAIVGSTVKNRGAMPAFDGAFVRRDERNVRPGRRSVPTRLAAHGVQGEVVILSASEKDITVAFELAFAEHREAELR